MISYTLRRILSSLPTLVGVALITFILFHVAGGDPILQLAGKHATPDEIAQLRHEYHLDRSLPVQFFQYLIQIFTLDFDRSFQTNQTIGTMLREGAWVSLSLALPAFVFSLLLSITLAMLAAAMRKTWVDRTIVVGSVFGMSLSILAYILFGQYFLAFQLGWFPISGYEPGFPERIGYLALPWLIWIALSLGSEIRFFRTVFLEEMNQDYVRTAYAKGASPFRVLFVHVLRNALLPIITRVVIDLPFLMLGSLLLENFFGIPGLGNLTVNAISNADWPVLKAITTLGSILYIFFNLLSDLLYAQADPRVVLK